MLGDLLNPAGGAPDGTPERATRLMMINGACFMEHFSTVAAFEKFGLLLRSDREIKNVCVVTWRIIYYCNNLYGHVTTQTFFISIHGLLVYLRPQLKLADMLYFEGPRMFQPAVVSTKGMKILGGRSQILGGRCSF